MIPKVRFEQFIDYPAQRSGWAYAQRSLAPLLTDAPDAIVLDTMIERNFARELDLATSEGRIPYCQPWAGFIHAPPDVPRWQDTSKSLRHIATLDQWRDSLPSCRGLITLSRDLRDWVRAQVPDVPVLALHHPTEFPARTFDFDTYVRHGQPVVQVGWWLRRLASIHFLPLPKARKHLLIPVGTDRMPRFLNALESERQHTDAPAFEQWHTNVLPRHHNADYDALLARSVVFLDLHAAVANNAVIECIVRRTPVLINRLPGAMEYLGVDYPLFFDSLDEAAVKATDPAQVRAAHEYLAAKDISFLSGETFCREFADSALYQSW
ncbi:MAG: hypothetical protein IPP90_15760 [Gemmatimonadaceae bacterium]|nr:hypothetical protein [Gemmatimonadaceae bacterium]